MEQIPTWDTIESDPAIFTNILQKLGVMDTEVIEMTTLDDLSLNNLPGVNEIYGIIFLFKHLPAENNEIANLSYNSHEIYFAKQVANNACATQALVNLLLNTNGELNIGQTLKELREMTGALDPFSRGEALAQHEEIRQIHNSFSPHLELRSMLSSARSRSSADAFHYVTYFHAHGALWELDGLQPAPIQHTKCEPSQWLQIATTILSRKIEAICARDNQGIGFNLLAVIPDRLKILKPTSDAQRTDMGISVPEVDRIEAIRAEQNLECIRKKHNYLPVVTSLLRSMAQNGDLKKVLDRYST